MAVLGLYFHKALQPSEQSKTPTPSCKDGMLHSICDLQGTPATTFALEQGTPATTAYTLPSTDANMHHTQDTELSQLYIQHIAVLADP